jgi:hypothetical protein
VQREIVDLVAVIGAAGGSACLYGHSSGCAPVMDTVLQAGAAGAAWAGLRPGRLPVPPGRVREYGTKQ